MPATYSTDIYSPRVSDKDLATAPSLKNDKHIYISLRVLYLKIHRLNSFCSRFLHYGTAHFVQNRTPGKDMRIVNDQDPK